MTMDSFESRREALISICQLVIEGKMHIFELDKHWPNNLLKSPFLSLLYDDIEEGIEHFPAKLFSKAPDWKMWKSSQIYLQLLLDCELLKSGKPEAILLTARNELVNNQDLTPDNLRSELSKVLVSSE
jgi:hypothetical protein